MARLFRLGRFRVPINKGAAMIRFIFAWYDLWIGAYWDRKSKRLYLLPVPCIGVVIDFAKEQRT